MNLFIQNKTRRFVLASLQPSLLSVIGSQYKNTTVWRSTRRSSLNYPYLRLLLRTIANVIDFTSLLDKTIILLGGAQLCYQGLITFFICIFWLLLIQQAHGEIQTTLPSCVYRSVSIDLLNYCQLVINTSWGYRNFN